MKLEHPVHAPEAGTVTELLVLAGSQVEAGTVLAVVTPEAAVRRPTPKARSATPE